MDTPSPYAIKSSRANHMWQRSVDTFRQLCGYRFPPLGRFAFTRIIETLPSVIETQLFPGIKATLDLRDETQRTTYWFGTRFEEPTPQVLQRWSTEATHFFDIGSNYGFYSFLLYSFAPRLDIYAFEPNSAPYLHLTEICSRNGASRIHAQPYGLSDENSRLKFLQLCGNTGHSSFATVEEFTAQHPTRSEASLIECDVMQFDQAVTQLKLCHPAEPAWIAKIDVEGYELKVLRGMAEALRKKVFKGICIELVEENLILAGAAVTQVDSFLREYGYGPISDHIVDPHRFHRNHNAFYVPIQV